MDEKLVESYLDNIAELVIDEDKIVTYKSLSKSFGIHVNTAKQLLYTFLTKQKSRNSFPISATYLLSGKLADGSFNISIVHEGNLKSTCLKFVEITSEHIYSIQKGKDLKEVKVLCGTDKDLSKVESPLVIKCSKSTLKSGGEVKKKSNSYQEINSKELIKEVLEPWKETVNLVEANTKAEGFVNKDSAIKSPEQKCPKGNPIKAQADTKKPTGIIAKLFANACQKNSNKSVNENENAFKKKEQRDTEPAGTSAVKAKDVNLKSEKRSSEIDNGSKDSLKRKISGSKRRRIQMISDSEDSDSNNEETSFAEESSPSIFPNSDDDKEEITEVVPKNKRKKRKIVDKTVMSEDGYLETRKEVVFETDSENEVEEKGKINSEQKKVKVAPVSDKGRAVQTANVAKKQSSLLTFFKKS